MAGPLSLVPAQSQGLGIASSWGSRCGEGQGAARSLHQELPRLPHRAFETGLCTETLHSFSLLLPAGSREESFRNTWWDVLKRARTFSWELLPPGEHWRSPVGAAGYGDWWLEESVFCEGGGWLGSSEELPDAGEDLGTRCWRLLFAQAEPCWKSSGLALLRRFLCCASWAERRCVPVCNIALKVRHQQACFDAFHLWCWE